MKSLIYNHKYLDRLIQKESQLWDINHQIDPAVPSSVYAPSVTALRNIKECHCLINKHNHTISPQTKHVLKIILKYWVKQYKTFRYPK